MLKHSYQNSSVAFATTSLRTQLSAKLAKNLYAVIARPTGSSKIPTHARFAGTSPSLIE